MRRTPALSFLLVSVAIDMLGLGLVVPVAPALLTGIAGGTAAGARWSGWINAGYGLAQFLAAPLLGRLADRYGRRPVLIISLAVLGLDYLAHARASHPVTLLASHALAGALAGTSTVVSAYVADTTPPAGRARAFGLVAAAAGAGFIGGPVLGGLLGGISLRLPFLVAGALALGNALYGALVLPESRPGDRATQLAWDAASPARSVVALAQRPGLGRLVTACALSDVARITNQVTWTFVVAARFGWGPGTIGVVLAVSGLSGTVAAAWLSGRFVTRLGPRRAAVVSAWAGAISLVGFGTMAAWLLIPLLVIGSVAALGGAAVQTWITSRTDPDEQGAVQGSLTAISALAEAGVPPVAGAVFGWSLGPHLPGLVLVLAGACAAGAALLLAAAGGRRDGT